jgi:hypothetical protein
VWTELGVVDGPEVGGGGSGAKEDGGAVERNVNGLGMEGGGAAVVAERGGNQRRERERYGRRGLQEGEGVDRGWRCGWR